MTMATIDSSHVDFEDTWARAHRDMITFTRLDDRSWAVTHAADHPRIRAGEFVDVWLTHGRKTMTVRIGQQLADNPRPIYSFSLAGPITPKTTPWDILAVALPQLVEHWDEEARDILFDSPGMGENDDGSCYVTSQTFGFVTTLSFVDGRLVVDSDRGEKVYDLKYRCAGDPEWERFMEDFAEMIS